MKRVSNVLLMMVVVSTLAFGGIFDKMFGPTKEEIAEFRYNYAVQLLNEDVSTYKGKVLNLDQVIKNITDGVILDDILQNGTMWTPTTDIPLTIDEIPEWAKKKEIEVSYNLATLAGTYKVKHFYNTGEARVAMNAYPNNVIPYSKDFQISIKEAMISSLMNADQIIQYRKDDLCVSLDKDSQAYADIFRLKKIKDYVVSYVEDKNTKTGKVVYDNNIVILSIPYTFDNDGNYSADMDLSEAVIEVVFRDSLTNEFISSEKFLIPDIFDASLLGKEKLLNLGLKRLTIKDSVERDKLEVTNFKFLRECYSEVKELKNAK